MLEQFIRRVQNAKLYGEGENPTAEQIADMLWLAMQMGAHPDPIESPTSSDTSSSPSPPPSTSTIEPQPEPEPSTEAEEVVETPPAAKLHADTSSSPSSGIPFKTPAVPALRHGLAISRAFKPLKRTVPSRTQMILDPKATAHLIAEERLPLAVLKPTPTRWLDVALVVEDSNSSGIWQQTVKEFHQLLLRQGAFRDVRLWYVRSNADDKLQLFPSHLPVSGSPRPPVSPKTLIDSEGRRLIFVLSDCVSPAWYAGQWLDLLQTWGRKNPVTILQMLPSQFWRRTALKKAQSVWMSSRRPGASNPYWQVESQSPWEEEADSPKGFPVPVVTFNPYALGVWAQAVAGLGGAQIAGYCFTQTSSKQPKSPAVPSFEDFMATTSPTARRLAALMAAVPVQLPIARLIQQTMLPQSDTTHLAEVFLSGILRRENQQSDPEKRLYRFVGEMRNKLLDSIPRSEAARVIDRVSAYIARRAGLSIQEFRALLMAPLEGVEGELEREIQAFARVTVEVLTHLGGEYAAFAAQLEGTIPPPPVTDEVVLNPEPTLETFSFEVATLVVVETEVFTFEVATLERRRGAKGRGSEWVIQRQEQQATGIIEVLEGEVRLELMEIPGGTFLMGSPEDEPERNDDESPQHEVTVPPFYLGRYPVTQAQWRVVAGWEKVERDLDPNPSRFKEPYEDYDPALRPVERVSWHDAVEFCARLSRATGWDYRLPSEAEWEYACRSVISHQSSVISESSGNLAYPPFHFGETISTEVANYDGNSTYGEGEKGEYREQTTPVGYFQVANGFGLYDLHGNVFEWCADPWHENYEGAPNDGSVWQVSDKNTTKVIRGGSWSSSPRYCRSASRRNDIPDIQGDLVGFRVARSA